MAATETLLDGTLITNTHDYKNQVTQKQSSGGPSRDEVVLTYHSLLFHDHYHRRHERVDAWKPEIKPITVGQDLRYTYSGGLLLDVDDRAQNSRSIYGHDLQRRCIHREVLFNDGVVRTMDAAFDPRGRQTMAHDTNAQIFQDYDAQNNKRHTRAIFTLSDDTNHSVDYWFNTDPANRITIDQGVLRDGVIQINSQQGVEVTYENNLRATERQYSGGRYVTTQLGYDEEDRLLTTTGDNQTSGSWIYALAGWVETYGETTQSYNITRTVTCDANRRQTQDEERRNGSIKQSTTIDRFTLDGSAQHRFTDLHRDSLTFDLTSEYEQFTNEQLTKIRGRTHNEHGYKNVKDVQLLYDVNRNPSATYGTDDGNQPSNRFNSEFIYFDRTHDGLILRRRHIMQGDGYLKENTISTYTDEQAFIDPSGRYFASYLYQGDPREQSPMKFAQHNMPTRRGGRWSAPESRVSSLMMGHPNRTMMFMLADPFEAIVSKPRPYTYHDYKRFTGIRKNKHKSYGGYVPQAMSTYPGTTPERYSVPTNGMTFEQISQAVTGSPRYADAIAKANPWAQNRTCNQGDVVQIPPLQMNFNSAIDTVPYERLMSALIGALSPHIEFKQKKDKGCLELMTTIVIMVVVTVLVPEMLPALTAFQIGLVSALVDAALQGIAVEVGLLSEFSWVQVLEAGVGGGLNRKFGMKQLGEKFRKGLEAKDMAKAMEQFKKIIAIRVAINVTEQLSEMAVGLRKQFDIREPLVVGAQTAIDLGIQLKSPPPKTDVAVFLEKTMSNMEGLIIGAAVMGAPIRLENFLAREVGSFLEMQAEPAAKYLRDKFDLNIPTSHTYTKGLSDGKGLSQENTYVHKSPKAAATPDETNYARSMQSTSNKPATSRGSNQPKLPASTLPEDSKVPRWSADPKTGEEEMFVSEAMEEWLNGIEQAINPHSPLYLYEINNARDAWDYTQTFGKAFGGNFATRFKEGWQALRAHPLQTIGREFVDMGKGIVALGQAELGLLRAEIAFVKHPIQTRRKFINGGKAFVNNVENMAKGFAQQDVYMQAEEVSNIGWDFFKGTVEGAGIGGAVGVTAKSVSLVGGALNTSRKVTALPKLSKFNRKFFDRPGVGAKRGALKAKPYDLEVTEPISRNRKQFKKFLAQVKENGITEPVKYVEHNGKKYVVDGHHRLRAAKMLEIKEVPIEQVKLPYKGYREVNDLLEYSGP